MTAEPSTIVIYGPGLLGGSLALAIQQRFPAAHLRLWARRPEAEAGIRQRGIQAEFYTDATAAAQGASLLILCTPVETMPALASQIARAELAPEGLVTDVGSVKGSVVRALEPVFGPRFIGSHPMAGSEKTGIDAARADLFQNAACILTPASVCLVHSTQSQANRLEEDMQKVPRKFAYAGGVSGAETNPQKSDSESVVRDSSFLARSVNAEGSVFSSPLSRLRFFWESVGCRVLEMSPEEHDDKVARISHLPHMMAVVTTLAALRTDPSAVACVANGFRDTTRVAGGDPGLWTGIALENRAALLAQLQAASATLTELLEILSKPDEEELRRFLAEAQCLRQTVPAVVS